MKHRSITPAMFNILVILSAGPLHGYGVMSRVEAMEGKPLGPGTLYRSIKQLLEMGLIEEIGRKDDGRRRSYRLTRSGAAVAAEEAARLDTVLQVARKAGLLDGLRRPRVNEV